MAIEYDTNLVLVRRGCGLLLNPYSPKGTSNDGLGDSTDLKWGYSSQYYKEQFVSDNTGSIYENANPEYIKRIKIGSSWYYGEKYPYIYFRIINKSKIKTSKAIYSYGGGIYGILNGYLETYNPPLNLPSGYTLAGHDIWNVWASFDAKHHYSKSGFIYDYNAYFPGSGTNNDTVTQSAVNAHPEWWNFKPVQNAIVYLALGTNNPSAQYPNGQTGWLVATSSVVYNGSNSDGFSWQINQTFFYTNDFNPARNGVIKYGTPPFDESQFTLLTDNSDIHHRPRWYRESGAYYDSSSIPYDLEFNNDNSNIDVILRDANDNSQPEYDISNNIYVQQNSIGTNTYNPDLPGYLEKNGAYTAFRTPNNETPYLMRNQIMKFDLRSDLVNGCLDACWHKNKVIKIKLKYQNGTVGIDKFYGSIAPTQGTKMGFTINYNWTTYEEETVDNIDIKFDQQDSNPYGILWSKEIECSPGQAKRLVDICVLEVRDKT